MKSSRVCCRADHMINAYASELCKCKIACTFVHVCVCACMCTTVAITTAITHLPPVLEQRTAVRSCFSTCPQLCIYSYIHVAALYGIHLHVHIHYYTINTLLHVCILSLPHPSRHTFIRPSIHVLFACLVVWPHAMVAAIASDQTKNE